MELMQRLGSEISDDYIDKYIKAILKYPDSCDTVWLATKYGFPKLEVHKETAELLKKAAEKFRENGIGVSLQLSNSIGHGEYMSRRDCSGLVFDGSPVEKMVGEDGTVADYCFCWRGENFRKYLLSELLYYAEAVKPDCVWVDDDFRAKSHTPVKFGCFCENCISEFNRLYGSDFTRETLVWEILYGNVLWRERYIKFVRDGLHDLMIEMGRVIHAASPDTAMGLQHGAFGAYTGFGMDFIFDAMKESTGHAPKSRPGGGAYDAHDPNDVLYKAVLLNWQNAQLPEYVRCKCPEIENLPFCVFGKTPASTAFETTHYFANGNTDMSYSMIMSLSEPMEWHEREFELLKKHRPYWERLSKLNTKTYQAGMRVFVSKNTWKKTLKNGDGFLELDAENMTDAYLWTRDAFPIAYEQTESSVFILHPECARILSDNELAYLLGQNVLTDGETIEILSSRGVDFGISATKMSERAAARLQEKMTDSPVNGTLKSWSSSHFVKGKKDIFYLERRGDFNINILAAYEAVLPCEQLSDDKEYPYGIADVIVKTPKNADWAVFGYSPWKGIMSFAKREQILNAADTICNRGLCTRLLTPAQAVLLPRKNSNGKTVCVSVTNCTIGESGELKLLIRNPEVESFTYMSQYSGSGKLEYKKCGDDYIVTVPSIKPWSVATIFCDK